MPESTPLYRIVQRHLPAMLAEARAHTAHGFGLPRFIEREFEHYLGCGILGRGFARVRCDRCAAEMVVAFSCKGRGVCPSCTARRMADAAAHLVDRVLPAARYRQWVWTMPRRVRYWLARDAARITRVHAMFVRAVFAWQRRVARKRDLVGRGHPAVRGEIPSAEAISLFASTTGEQAQDLYLAVGQAPRPSGARGATSCAHDVQDRSDREDARREREAATGRR